ncbi:MAG: ROK family protein, partial [Acidimicrobiales bacterium]
MTPAGAAPSAAPCLALDIGATKVAAAVVDPDGEISDVRRVDVGDADDLLERIVALARELADASEVSSVGVACAGPMRDHGALVSPLNIPSWRDVALRDALADSLGVAVFVDGDARALALAEGRFGAARGVASYLSMVVSTGVGGGLVLDGRLVDGASGNAGHVGHLTVVPDGRECACGARGCLEAEASGRAIAAVTGADPRDANLAVRSRCARLVGRAVGTLAAVLDFTRCFIGGSVALGYGDDFFVGANAAAGEVARLDYARDLVI